MVKFAKYALLAGMASVGLVVAGPVVADDSDHPSVEGTWIIYPDPFEGEENLFSELQVPNGGPKLKEPYASEWKARRDLRDKMLAEGTPLVDASTLCIPEGMPSIMGAIFPLQILEAPDQIVVLGEFLAQTRRIFLDADMPADGDFPPSYFGFSSGHWDGDTLVVTTKGVREDVQFFEIPHSANMTITERIHYVEPDVLENEITIDDPEVLLEPYSFTYGYKRNDDYRMMEFYCDRVDPLFKVDEDGIVSMKVEEHSE